MGDSVSNSPRAVTRIALSKEHSSSLGAEEDEGLHITTNETLSESRLDLEATETASLSPKKDKYKERSKRDTSLEDKDIFQNRKHSLLLVELTS